MDFSLVVVSWLQFNVGVSSSLLEINRESLVFEDTTAASHSANSNVTNLSVLFLQEFSKN